MFIKRLPKFECHAPGTMAEALEQLAEYGERGAVLAGGTDLLVSMKKREKVPAHLINLKGIEDLKGIDNDGVAGIKIGGLTTLGELERSKIVKENFSILWDAVNVMAAPQVRNLGTIGGNLCGAIPSADTAPPLIASGASVKLIGIKGERTVLVEDFFEGPGKSVLKGDEILTQIFIPNPPENGGGAYLKLMRRSAMDLALVGVAAHLMLDGAKKICKGVKIALGAVASTPIRAPKAEEILLNKEINEDLAADAGRVASREARPISDIRATEGYRTEMIGVLTKRAVVEACKRIRGKSG